MSTPHLKDKIRPPFSPFVDVTASAATPIFVACHSFAESHAHKPCAITERQAHTVTVMVLESERTNLAAHKSILLVSPMPATRQTFFFATKLSAYSPLLSNMVLLLPFTSPNY